jgi:predicted transcriptional regulator
MTTLIIEVASEADALAQAIAAVESDRPQPRRYLFDSEEALLDTLTGNRFAILKALCGAGPTSAQALARRLGSDLGSVNADAERLVAIGLIDHDDDGALHFPYAAVHLELDWPSAA